MISGPSVWRQLNTVRTISDIEIVSNKNCYPQQVTHTQTTWRHISPNLFVNPMKNFFGTPMKDKEDSTFRELISRRCFPLLLGHSTKTNFLSSNIYSVENYFLKAFSLGMVQLNFFYRVRKRNSSIISVSQACVKNVILCNLLFFALIRETVFFLFFKIFWGKLESMLFK